MFQFDIEETLKKRLKLISKKDKILFENFRKKVYEIINQDLSTINTYKNLKSPQNEYKRIYLISQFILIFKVKVSEKKIIFVDIAHRRDIYKKL